MRDILIGLVDLIVSNDFGTFDGEEDRRVCLVAGVEGVFIPFGRSEMESVVQWETEKNRN